MMLENEDGLDKYRTAYYQQVVSLSTELFLNWKDQC